MKVSFNKSKIMNIEIAKKVMCKNKANISFLILDK